MFSVFSLHEVSMKVVTDSKRVNLVMFFSPVAVLSLSMFCGLTVRI